MRRFYFDFYQCAIIITGKARYPALRGKNRTKLDCPFWRKKSHTVMHCQKIVDVFVNNSGTGRDISKITADLDSAVQKQFFYLNSIKKT
jgi:hypothetical protein